MEPRIQYAKTSDGVSIAYTVLGSGPAIIFPSSLFGNIHMYKSVGGAGTRPYDTLVSLGWTVITYDGRGTGSSDRDIDDWSLGARMRDLETVVERAAPERFALCGERHGGLVSISYAVPHAQRLTCLILSNTFADGSAWRDVLPVGGSPQTPREAEDNWEYATLMLANAFVGFTDSERARRMAEAFRAGMTATDYIAFRNETETINVSDLLPQISVPTIVVFDRRLGALGRVGAITQRLAPPIPDARFVDTDNLAGVIDEFLRERGLLPTPQAQRADPSEPRAGIPTGMTAILFADIADSTALTERLGDAAFRAKARDLDAALRGVIRDHAGSCIDAKTLGDGVLATFVSARHAITAALACARAGDEAGLPLHLGLHAGDVIREDNNVFGGAVNIAARVSALAAPGEVLVSETIRSLARTSAGVRFEDRGEQKMKGVGEPVRVWAVREAE
jgi:class 3 adenylate cyclase/pimeloyl-ACP methyl ester carboxylesterase